MNNLKTFENFKPKFGFFANYSDNKKDVSMEAAIDGYSFFERELEFVKFLVTIKDGQLSVSMDKEFREGFSNKRIKLYEEEILDELKSFPSREYYKSSTRFGYEVSPKEIYLYYEDGTRVSR